MVTIVLVVLWLADRVFSGWILSIRSCQIDRDSGNSHVLQSMGLHLAGRTSERCRAFGCTCRKKSLRGTHGLSDSRQLLGKFKGEESGKAMLYIRRGETPVLKIELPEYTVFINSEESGKVQEWYEELSS